MTASPGAARLARAANGTPWPGSSSIGGTIRNGCLVVAVADADVVDLAVRREMRDRLLVPVHRRGDGDPEQALGADLGAQRPQDLAREARAALERAPVAVVR